MQVQATDGFLYTNPTICGEDAFFTAVDKPGITVRCFPQTTFRSAKQRAGKVLEQMGIPHRWVNDYEDVRVSFPPAFDGMCNAKLIYFNLIRPIPVPESHEGKHAVGINDEDWLGEHRRVFEMEFGVGLLQSLVTGQSTQDTWTEYGINNFPEKVAKFLFGNKVPKNLKLGLKRAILKQHPQLKELQSEAGYLKIVNYEEEDS